MGTRLRAGRTGAALAGAALAGVVLAGAALALGVGPAAHGAPAHSVLIGSTPAAGETLTELPDEFSVTMNEPMLDVGGTGAFALQVRDADGRYYGDGCLELVDAVMSTSAALGEPGEYTMLWQVVSADGHPVGGEIPFRWEPAGDVEPSEPLAEPPVCGEAGAPATGSTEPTPGAADAGDVDVLPWVLGIAGVGLAAGGFAAGVAFVTAGSRRRSG